MLQKCIWNWIAQRKIAVTRIMGEQFVYHKQKLIG